MIVQCCSLYSGTAINAAGRNEYSVKPKKLDLAAKLELSPKPIVIDLRSSLTTPTARNPERRIQRLQRLRTSYQ
jgi:hypothetical protein